MAETNVILTKTCILCGKRSELTLTAEENAALATRAFVQDALPTRDAAFRELVISGTHGECWAQAFGVEDED